MKTLYIIRHAKSSWSLETLNDFDRPLNERGHSDAPAMAKRLLDKKINIDVMISSTANRALTTAQYFAKAFNKNIIEVPQLYHANVKTFYSTIININDTYDDVAIFSHNPHITYFINTLTPTQIDDMPTCGIFAIQAQCFCWKDFEQASKQFLFFDYPKAR